MWQNCLGNFEMGQVVLRHKMDTVFWRHRHYFTIFLLWRWCQKYTGTSTALVPSSFDGSFSLLPWTLNRSSMTPISKASQNDFSRRIQPGRIFVFGVRLWCGAWYGRCKSQYVPVIETLKIIEVLRRTKLEPVAFQRRMNVVIFVTFFFTKYTTQ